MSSNNNNSLMAILAYLGILVVVPFLTDAKSDPFVKFHIKQGLVLLIVELVGTFIYSIPIIGGLLGNVIWVGSVIWVIIGIMNVTAGKTKELPLIGKYSKYINF